MEQVKRFVPTIKLRNKDSSHTKGVSVVKYMTDSVELESGFDNISVHKNHTMYSKAYWIRVFASKEKADVRVDCLALPSSMLEEETSLPREGKTKACFFTPDLTAGLDSVFTTYPAVELIAADCSVQDVSDIYSIVQAFSGLVMMCHLYTCQNFIVKLSSFTKCEYISCDKETRATTNAAKFLLDSEHKPVFQRLCLQKWNGFGSKTADQLQHYCKKLPHLSVVKFEQCKFGF